MSVGLGLVWWIWAICEDSWTRSGCPLLLSDRVIVSSSVVQISYRLGSDSDSNESLIRNLQTALGWDPISWAAGMKRNCSWFLDVLETKRAWKTGHVSVFHIKILWTQHLLVKWRFFFSNDLNSDGSVLSVLFWLCVLLYSGERMLQRPAEGLSPTW